MTEIYCGNNKLSPRLETMRRGTKYECMKKGIGVALHMPVDEDFLGEYKPIDKRKTYCGNKTKLPKGYSIMGSPSKCLVKGIGVGKKIKAERGDMYDDNGGYEDDYAGYSPSYSRINTEAFALLCLVWSVSIFVFLYIQKPRIVSIRDTTTGKPRINWRKFSIVYGLSCLLFTVCLYFIMKSLDH